MKIDFEFDTKHGKYRDALHLPDNHTFSEAEIQAMKEQRRDNWINVVDNPPPPPPPDPDAIQSPPETVEIAGDMYFKLYGSPPSGAKLIEVSGVWYYKV